MTISYNRNMNWNERAPKKDRNNAFRNEMKYFVHPRFHLMNFRCLTWIPCISIVMSSFARTSPPRPQISPRVQLCLRSFFYIRSFDIVEFQPPYCASLVSSPANSILYDSERRLMRRRSGEAVVVAEGKGRSELLVRQALCIGDNCNARIIEELGRFLETLQWDFEGFRLRFGIGRVTVLCADPMASRHFEYLHIFSANFPLIQCRDQILQMRCLSSMHFTFISTC